MTYELFIYRNDVRQDGPPVTEDVWQAERQFLAAVDAHRDSPDRVYIYTLVSSGTFPARFVVERPFISDRWSHLPQRVA